MISSKSGPWVALALLAGGMVAGPAAHAQTIEFKYGDVRAPEDPSAALSRHIRTLAASPRSLSALKGAAAASLELGDPQTALTFLARAEEVVPRDGEVKAGMGSAFVLMEEPEAALRFFAEAQALGEAEATFAKDRGLAYDLTGDPRRAQADYALALKRSDDSETRERLALSLAISGDREGALAVIDKLVRSQDRSAWRTRAFVLALTGDAAGATAAAEAVMPAQASQWRPFFARLPGLNPAERAMAVHFGRFPAGSAAGEGASAEPARHAENSPTQAGQPDSSQVALGGKRKPVNETRRRPDNRAAATSKARAPASGASEDRVGKARQLAAQAPTDKPMPPSRVPTSAGSVALAASEPAATANKATTPQLAAKSRVNPTPATGNLIGPPTASSSSAGVGGPASAPAASAPVVAKKPPVRIPFGAPTSGTPPTRTQVTAAPETAPATTHANFASVIAAVEALPTPLRNAPSKAPAPATKSAKLETAKADAKDVKGKDAPAAKPGEKDKKAAAAKKKAEPAKPKEPSRIWVQVAGGANKADLPKAFSQLKAKAPKLLGGRTAWTTPLRATNRLLVGPFKTEKEARTFVNDLAKLKLDGFSWTSPEGQEITKLPAK
ncbi:SPOR domain-containing protein [Allosphingosinicella humi]